MFEMALEIVGLIALLALTAFLSVVAGVTIYWTTLDGAGMEGLLIAIPSTIFAYIGWYLIASF
jgi:hypothetical protein